MRGSFLRARAEAQRRKKRHKKSGAGTLYIIFLRYWKVIPWLGAWNGGKKEEKVTFVHHAADAGQGKRKRSLFPMQEG